MQGFTRDIASPYICDLLILLSGLPSPFSLIPLSLALSQWEREEKSEAMFQGEGSQMLGLTITVKMG
jgi:hypothetical protein